MDMSGSTATRRYARRFWGLIASYLLLLAAVVWAMRTASFTPLARYALAVAPAAPLVGIVITMGLYLKEETDEFRRLTVVQSFLAGLGVTLVVTTVWGFLEMLADAPRLPLFMVFPIFCVGMGAAQPLIRRWYR